MSIRLIVAAVCVNGVLATYATSANAQALGALTRAKRSATAAVAATNAHMQVMQGDSAPAPTVRGHGHAMASTAPTRHEMEHASPAAPRSARSSDPRGRPAPGAAGKHDVQIAASGNSPGEGARSGELSLVRETFTYTVDGRRDPFLSLLKTGELRPMISDLKLVTIIYDPAGRSVAILRDLSTKEQYRVKVGQTLGRMRVASIQPKAITFTLEELGFSRQEVLAFNDTTSARSQ